MAEPRIFNGLVIGVLAAATIVSTVAQFNHAATAHHAICLEHGQLVDLGAGATPHHRSESTVAPDGADASDHQHCSLSTTALERTVLQDIRCSSSALHSVSAVFVLAAAPVPAQPYRVAPKTSPPA